MAFTIGLWSVIHLEAKQSAYAAGQKNQLFLTFCSSTCHSLKVEFNSLRIFKQQNEKKRRNENVDFCWCVGRWNAWLNLQCSTACASFTFILFVSKNQNFHEQFIICMMKNRKSRGKMMTKRSHNIQFKAAHIAMIIIAYKWQMTYHQKSSHHRRRLNGLFCSKFLYSIRSMIHSFINRFNVLHIRDECLLIMPIFFGSLVGEFIYNRYFVLLYTL